jgi:hypothetical protein
VIGPIRAHELDNVAAEITSKIKQYNMGNFLVPAAKPFLQQRSEGNYSKIFGTDDGYKVLGKFNDFGCRCDDFKKDHGGKLHVLFAGCSMTYGEGLPIEDVWSYLVHQYINSITETSGYFNVGKTGINFHEMLNQIMGYMKYAGKPDVIFLMLPEIGREFLEYPTQMWPMNVDALNTPGKDEIPTTIKNFRERLINFKIMCDLLGIKLVIGCWAMNMRNHGLIVSQYSDPFRDIEVVNVAGKTHWLQDFREHDLGHPEIEKEILDSLDIKDPRRKMVYLALDDAHPGLLGQKIMAHYIIEHLKKSDIFHKN